jgi:hypothetical protein
MTGFRLLDAAGLSMTIRSDLFVLGAMLLVTRLSDVRSTLAVQAETWASALPAFTLRSSDTTLVSTTQCG